METTTEQTKCKNDILYFLDNYVQPKLELTGWQRELLRNLTFSGPNDVIFKPRPWGTATINRVLNDWRVFCDGNKY